MTVPDAADAEVDFSLLSEAFQLDPPATFAALRERCPVHHTDVPAPHYSLSREVDVSGALRDDETWSSKYGPGLAYGQLGAGVLVASDPPNHTTERLAISRAFKPSVIEAMEPDIRALVNGLVDELIERGQGDLIQDFAMALPLNVMCWLLGTPTEDIAIFRTWVLPMAEAVAYAGGREATDEVVNAYRDYNAYFGPHIARRAEAIAAGADVPDDLLTRLLTVERDGQRLTQPQVVAFCQFLLVAGSETTTLLIGNMVHRLLRAPRPARPHPRGPEPDRQRHRGEPPLRCAGARPVPYEQLPGHDPRRRDPGRFEGLHDVRLGQPRPGGVGRPRPLRHHP